MRSPFSSTMTAGTPIFKLAFPLVESRLRTEWQVVQVRPSESKRARSTFGVFRQRAADYADGIVAAIAVAGKGDSAGLVADEDVDTGAIEGRSESVGVQGLTPLTISLLMTRSAVLGSGERARLNEAITLNLDVSGHEGIRFAVTEVIGWSHDGVMLLAGRSGILLGFGLPGGEGLALGGGVPNGRSVFGTRRIRERREDCGGGCRLWTRWLLGLALENWQTAQDQTACNEVDELGGGPHKCFSKARLQGSFFSVSANYKMRWFRWVCALTALELYLPPRVVEALAVARSVAIASYLLGTMPLPSSIAK